MSAFDFRSYARLPNLDHDRIPFKLVKRNFRRYTAYVDIHDPEQFGTLNDIFIGLIRRDRFAQVSAHATLDKCGVTACINEFRARRPTEAFEPDFVDLLLLYSYIVAARPERVLEFGSGLSTVVMARALMQNGSGSLVSLEPSEEWSSATSSAMPEHLRQYARVEQSGQVACEIHGRKSVRFTDLPFKNPDMVYIDGAPAGAYFSGAESLSPLELRPGTAIFVDGRYRAVEFFLIGEQSGRNDVRGWSMSVREAITGRSLGFPLGLDQFANAMVIVRG